MYLNEHTEQELRAWLISHEIDIALGIEDYGELRNLFVAVMNRLPSKESPA